MVTINVEDSRFAEGMRELLAHIHAGESVALEHHGRVVARVAPQPVAKPTALWAALAKLPPLDDDFEKDIAELDKVVYDKPHQWE